MLRTDAAIIRVGKTLEWTLVIFPCVPFNSFVRHCMYNLLLFVFANFRLNTLVSSTDLSFPNVKIVWQVKILGLKFFNTLSARHSSIRLHAGGPQIRSINICWSAIHTTNIRIVSWNLVNINAYLKVNWSYHTLLPQVRVTRLYINTLNHTKCAFCTSQRFQITCSRVSPRITMKTCCKDTESRTVPPFWSTLYKETACSRSHYLCNLTTNGTHATVAASPRTKYGQCKWWA